MRASSIARRRQKSLCARGEFSVCLSVCLSVCARARVFPSSSLKIRKHHVSEPETTPTKRRRRTTTTTTTTVCKQAIICSRTVFFFSVVVCIRPKAVALISPRGILNQSRRFFDDYQRRREESVLDDNRGIVLCWREKSIRTAVGFNRRDFYPAG